MSIGKVIVLGGGLAGCEAAHAVVKAGGKAVIHEMKPERFSPAHTMETLGELVCSNSLKSESIENASGVLKEEMRLLGSLVLQAADRTRVPAGKTLAVDRTEFSAFMTAELTALGVEIIRGEVVDLPPDRPLIIATGPLTSDVFAGRIQTLVGAEALNFYDAVAPIVYADSIDLDRVFRQSRYGKGGDDYINCPLSEEEYQRFYEELVKADIASARSFEDMRSFEACMPIEVMAHRGVKTLLFGPMRPVGLIDPATGRRPFAVVQLRSENAGGTLYNLVGFQTRLTFSEQKRVLGLIPALSRAEYARYGKLHRNSYIDSPRLLMDTGQLRAEPSIIVAGQLTGVEGYVESSVSGIMAGINAARIVRGQSAVCPPLTTVTGALLRHISDGSVKKFSPMNANFGLLPEVPGRDRREVQAKRALEDMARWVNDCLAT